MAPTLAEVVRHFKADVGKALSATLIAELCQALQYAWRERTLDPATTIHLFLTQILHGNVACAALPHLAGLFFSAAAYVKARARLPLALFEKLLEGVVAGLDAAKDSTGRWRGHRTWLLDGSSFSMADTPALQERFGQPGVQKKGCGFPVAHLLALFHAGTGVLQRIAAAPLRTHDLKHAAVMHAEMKEGDVLLADRGFASFAHLALLLQRKMHAVFRCHQKQIVDFRPGRKHTSQRNSQAGRPRSRWLKRLGKHDQLVEYAKPVVKPQWMAQDDYDALPPTLAVRELRFTISQPGRRTRVITLVATLLDPVAYPAAELAALYAQRWQVELDFRHLKTTMKMEILHCQSVAGVLKELAMFALAYNLVRLVMLEASRRQKAPLERISFIDALRWLRAAQPGAPLTDLVVNPARPGRWEPRVRKRRPKEYDLMTKPRQELRDALENQGKTA